MLKKFQLYIPFKTEKCKKNPRVIKIHSKFNVKNYIIQI